jgi:uncharacterized protein (DUF1330 family)
MPAYVVSEVRILDMERAETYMRLAAASIERRGGRYLVRGAIPAVPEGDWEDDRRVVIVEFADRQQLDEWYSSDEYAKALRYRDALDRRLLVVDGV